MNDRIYSYSTVMMGSPILLKLFIDDASIAKAAFQRIKQLENLLTVNQPHSQLMQVNQAAGKHPVSVHPLVFELVSAAKAVSLLPDSLFNLAIGPLVKRWRIGFRGDCVPPEAELSVLRQLIHPEDVQLDPTTYSIYLAQSGMELDLGAIAKGFIADQVKTRLEELGVDQGLINLGGNVLTLGQHADMKHWHIGLQKPFAAHDEYLGVIEVAGKSVVTSGIYERYFEFEGQRYHHILDGNTGYPLNNELQSVTVISDRSIDGDIFTTLLYGFGIKKSLSYLEQHPEIEAIFVTKNHQVILSSARQFCFHPHTTEYEFVSASSFQDSIN